MINKLIKAIAVPMTALALLFVPVLLLSATVSAQPVLKDGFCSGANFTTSVGDPDCTTNVSTDNFQQTVTNIVNLITFIVGAVAVVMIIYGGFKYITSGGDPGKVTSAKNTILYGLIGLVIVAVAQVLTRFIITYTTDTFQ